MGGSLAPAGGGKVHRGMLTDISSPQGDGCKDSRLIMAWSWRTLTPAGQTHRPTAARRQAPLARPCHRVPIADLGEHEVHAATRAGHAGGGAGNGNNRDRARASAAAAARAVRAGTAPRASAALRASLQRGTRLQMLTAASLTADPPRRGRLVRPHAGGPVRARQPAHPRHLRQPQRRRRRRAPRRPRPGPPPEMRCRMSTSRARPAMPGTCSAPRLEARWAVFFDHLDIRWR